MTKDTSVPKETANQILRVLFEGGEKIGSPMELAEKAEVEAKAVWDALGDPFLIELIRRRSTASIWAAVPSTVNALLEKAVDGSVPHARLMLDVSGFTSESRREAASTDEEDEFDRLSDEELINYIQRALDFAKGSRPDPHGP